MSYEPSQPKSPSVHLPIAFIALTLAIFLGAQITAVSEQIKLLRWQIQNADTQDANLKTQEKQYKSLVAQRGDVVKQSSEIQNKFQSLFQDLLKLADNDDEDAKKVVEKWKIQRAAGAGADQKPAEEKPAAKEEAKPADKK